MSPLKILFAGTPDFSVPCLKALLEAGHRLVAVYTQPDRPAGRGRKLRASPVKQAALATGLPVYQPETLRDTGAIDVLRNQGADLMVVVAYGLLLPQEVLSTPPLGCINVHASILPRWRGAAPIQRAILAGDDESGVTIMAMEAGLDRGPMYHIVRLALATRETAGSLHDRLADTGAAALMEALPGITDGSRIAQAQDDTLATYAKKLSKEEAMIDWSRSAVEIDRQVRAFNPWPVAQTTHAGGTLRLWESEPLPGGDAAAAPGDLVAASKTGIDIAAGHGVLRVTRLQPPGKLPMTAAEFLNARNIDGHTFG